MDIEQNQVDFESDEVSNGIEMNEDIALSEIQTKVTHLTEQSKAFLVENDYQSDESSESEEGANNFDESVGKCQKYERVKLVPGESGREILKYYRGILNLKKYEWDLNEYLPIEYSQLYKFKDYEYQRGAVLESCDCRDTVIFYFVLYKN